MFDQVTGSSKHSAWLIYDTVAITTSLRIKRLKSLHANDCQETILRLEYNKQQLAPEFV